ncbi:predicted protein [Lichtheimia corymbifera JMRC:FSU:9682]|uniref:Uncharacterized protein n=1 Tax=Lichtheimia corymbifera JMRC:FSU:9682 TaxID=1263082 RepID=A0A068SFL4_9FUNG|nr:predicted protein [Lichtheimia corymbifera JMRC:FSU:9682]
MASADTITAHPLFAAAHPLALFYNSRCSQCQLQQLSLASSSGIVLFIRHRLGLLYNQQEVYAKRKAMARADAITTRSVDTTHPLFSTTLIVLNANCSNRH